MKYTLLLIIIAIVVICWVVYQFLTGKRKTTALEVTKPEEPKAPTPPETPTPPATPPVI
jgi:hypothetical protein